MTTLIQKVYFIENSTEACRAMNLLKKPEFALKITTEFIEMDFVELTVMCLPSQIAGIEHILAPFV